MPIENDQFKAKGGVVVGAGEAPVAELESGKLKIAQIPISIVRGSSESLMSPVTGSSTAGFRLRDSLSVKDFGAKGTGEGDDSSAIQLAMEESKEIGYEMSSLDGTTHIPIKQTVVIPDGIYPLGKSLNVVQGVSLVEAGGGSVLKATKEMASMLTGSNNVRLQNQIFGGRWDCNNQAEHGINIPYFAELPIPFLQVLNAKSHSVILGSSEALHPSYGASIGNLLIARTHGASIPSGSYGLWLYSNDSTVAQSNVQGASTSYRIDGSHCTLSLCHGWGLPEVNFDDNGEGNTYISPYADTPGAYGFIFRKTGGSVIGGVCYKSVNGEDNKSIAFKVEGEPLITLIGPRVEGATAEHRWAADFEGTLKTVTWLGKACANVVSKKYANQITGEANSPSLVIRRPTGTGAPLQITSPTEEVNAQFTSSSQLDIASVGSGISVKEGSNAKQGVATLTAGKVVVSNTSVTANSRIFLTAQKLGTVSVPSGYGIGTIVVGTSFEIVASSVTDTSTIAYQIFEPG